MMTHAENFICLTFGGIQGAVLAALVTPIPDLPKWLVFIASLAVGMVLAALELSFVLKIAEKLGRKNRR